MMALTPRSLLSPPLIEPASSTLDHPQLPARLAPALDFISDRLAARDIHVTFVAVRRDYQVPAASPASPLSSSTPTFSSFPQTTPSAAAARPSTSQGFASPPSLISSPFSSSSSPTSTTFSPLTPLTSAMSTPMTITTTITSPGAAAAATTTSSSSSSPSPLSAALALPSRAAAAFLRQIARNGATSAAAAALNTAVHQSSSSSSPPSHLAAPPATCVSFSSPSWAPSPILSPDPPGHPRLPVSPIATSPVVAAAPASPPLYHSACSLNGLCLPAIPRPPERFGLLYDSLPDREAEELLETLIQKAERKFYLGIEWHSATNLPSVSTPINILVTRSAQQNNVLFSSDHVTVFSLDRLYTLKAALSTYSRIRMPSRLADAVDELRRLVISRRTTGSTAESSRAELLQAYEWLAVADTAIDEVDRLYTQAYGASGIVRGAGLVGDVKMRRPTGKKTVRWQDQNAKPSTSNNSSISSTLSAASSTWSTGAAAPPKKDSYATWAHVEFQAPIPTAMKSPTPAALRVRTHFDGGAAVATKGPLPPLPGARKLSLSPTARRPEGMVSDDFPGFSSVLDRPLQKPPPSPTRLPPAVPSKTDRPSTATGAVGTRFPYQLDPLNISPLVATQSEMSPGTQDEWGLLLWGGDVRGYRTVPLETC